MSFTVDSGKGDSSLRNFRDRQVLFAEAQPADGDALDAAAHFGVTACDARFLLVARALGSPPITEDAKLRRVAPRYSQSLAEALAALTGN